MSMRLTVIDPRGSRVNNAESNINFAGRPGKIDHIMSFPAPIFKTPGQYFYVIDLDGKEAGRIPLFTVKVEGETSGSQGSGGPSDFGAKTEAQPPPSGPPPKDATDNPLKAATSQDP
jgi:hypothetical protein